MKKIAYEPLRDARHAHEKSIDIWTVLANMPDGTYKEQVIMNGYYCNCPLCEYYYRISRTKCQACPIDFCTGAYYGKWFIVRTAANAQAVLNQLHDTYKQRYGEEYVTDIMEQLKG